MRDVSRKVCEAFIKRQPKRVKNTTTDGSNLWLHGNIIAWWEGPVLHFTLAGWNSTTTRERLNALFSLLGTPLRVCQHKHEPMIYNYTTRETWPISSHHIYKPSVFYDPLVLKC